MNPLIVKEFISFLRGTSLKDVYPKAGRVMIFQFEKDGNSNIIDSGLFSDDDDLVIKENHRCFGSGYISAIEKIAKIVLFARKMNVLSGQFDYQLINTQSQVLVPVFNCETKTLITI